MNGVKPCIVSFANWKDKENVLRQAKLLKGCGIYITGRVSFLNKTKYSRLREGPEPESDLGLT